MAPISSCRRLWAISVSRPSLREMRDRVGHVAERLQALANEDHAEEEHEKNADAGDERHALDAVPEHGIVNLDRHADIENADRLALRIEDRLVGGVELAAEQDRGALVGLAVAEIRLTGMVGREHRSDRALAVLLLHVGGAADEVVARRVVFEHGGVAARIRGGQIHERVIAEGRYVGGLDADDLVVLHLDLGVGIFVGVGERQRAQIDLDVVARLDGEFVGERPIGRRDDAGRRQRDHETDQDKRPADEAQPIEKPLHAADSPEKTPRSPLIVTYGLKAGGGRG